jgi:glycosyltransferase involved in cell wall biosynthesis
MIVPLPDNKKLTVVYIHRRRRPNSNYSLEAIFEDVRRRLSEVVESRVLIVPFYSNGLIRRLLIMVAAWRGQGPVNHVTGDINYAGILIASSRVVLTIADCGFLDRTTGIRRALLKWFWLKLPVRRAGIITTISEDAKREIIRHTGCPSEKIRVIPVAISEDFQPVEARPFPPDPRILQVGTAPNKNVRRVIEALSGIPCVLVIVGELSSELQGLIRETCIRVENLVNLTSARIIEQYVQCDLVMFASTVEGFGMPILEAQAVGRPVITSAVSSMPEVAGDAACLVDPFDVKSIRDGVLRIISEGEYRRSLVEAGYRNIQRFNPQEIALRYFEVYQELLQRVGEV